MYCIWDAIGEGFGYYCELTKEDFDYDDGYCEEYKEYEVMDMIKTIFNVICLMALLFSCLYYIKIEITYKNLKIISDAIYRYNISMIKDERYDELISYDDIKSCEKTFLNIFDWGYKNLLPKDTYMLIEPFIKKC